MPTVKQGRRSYQHGPAGKGGRKVIVIRGVSTSTYEDIGLVVLRNSLCF